MKKHILILSKSELHSDPRILKQIDALKDNYDITAVGYTKSNVKGLKNDLDILIRDFSSPNIKDKLFNIFNLYFNRYHKIYWTTNLKKVHDQLSKMKFDLILANEINTLPLAVSLSNDGNVPIYNDLHEYYFVNKGKSWYHKISKGKNIWLANTFFPYVSHFTTINPGVIKLYKEEYDIDCQLVDNACRFFDLAVRPTNPNNIRLITHGAAIRGRKLELMIDVVALLDDRFTLDMYLMPTNKEYIQELESKARLLPKGKVNTYPGIPFSDIQKTINQYDIGLYIIFPTHLNNKLSLPNKLFEFIQGRVAIAIGPSESMVTVMDEYNIGVIADSFDPKNMADKINSLTERDIDKFKQNTVIAAKERNSEQNIIQIQQVVMTLLKSNQ